MKKWSFVLLFSNLIDGAATAFVISNQIYVEYNPLVRYLYSVHPSLFLIGKAVLLGIGISAMVANPTDTATRLTFKAVTVFYTLLAIYQVAALTLLWLYS